MKTGEKVSDQLERWLCGEEPKTLGSLIELFGEKSFAAVFVLLLAIPALPLPTGGATHILEAIAMLLALELMAGRRELWLPQRWRQFQLAGASQGRFSNLLLARIRWLERFSRPRLSRLLNHRVSGVVFGTIVFAMTAAAFLAPPFTGLDTLPSMGVVVLSLGVLLEDSILAIVGVLVGALGVVVVIGVGRLVVEALRHLL